MFIPKSESTRLAPRRAPSIYARDSCRPSYLPPCLSRLQLYQRRLVLSGKLPIRLRLPAKIHSTTTVKVKRTSTPKRSAIDMVSPLMLDALALATHKLTLMPVVTSKCGTHRLEWKMGLSLAGSDRACIIAYRDACESGAVVMLRRLLLTSLCSFIVSKALRRSGRIWGGLLCPSILLPG